MLFRGLFFLGGETHQRKNIFMVTFITTLRLYDIYSFIIFFSDVTRIISYLL